MASYQAPLRFMRFLLHEVYDTEGLLKNLNVMTDFNVELMDAILDEAANFSQQVLLPINRNGDEQGCTYSEGLVTTPDGFKEAYQQFLDGGWAVMGCSEEYGGQPIPKALHLMVEEIFYSQRVRDTMLYHKRHNEDKDCRDPTQIPRIYNQ